LSQSLRYTALNTFAHPNRSA